MDYWLQVISWATDGSQYPILLPASKITNYSKLPDPSLSFFTQLSLDDGQLATVESCCATGPTYWQ